MFYDGIFGGSGLEPPHSGKAQVLVAGVAALVAGAMAMAAGEYVSVSSQADTESADLAKEQLELENSHDHELDELDELAAIYVMRGVEHTVAVAVARQLMAHDALGAHARDELGITAIVSARPVQAALASAASFAVGAALPLVTVMGAPERFMMAGVSAVSLLSLTALGALSAKVGGASIARASMRVLGWGAFAMAVTAGVGAWFGARA